MWVLKSVYSALAYQVWIFFCSKCTKRNIINQLELSSYDLFMHKLYFNLKLFLLFQVRPLWFRYAADYSHSLQKYKKREIWLNTYVIYWWLINGTQCDDFKITFLQKLKQIFAKMTCSIYVSMTPLFARKVAQPTKWRFLPKNLSQLVIFVIGVGLAFTWVWGHKNRAQF